MSLQATLEILGFLQYCQARTDEDVVVRILSESQEKREAYLVESATQYVKTKKLDLVIGIAQVLCICRFLHYYDAGIRNKNAQITSDYDRLFLSVCGPNRPAHRTFMNKAQLNKPTMRQFTVVTLERKACLAKRLAIDLASVDIFSE
jgi:hypothetical protein